MITLDEMARRANEAHMTYGQYVAMFHGPGTEGTGKRRTGAEKAKVCKVCGKPLPKGRTTYCCRACYAEDLRRKREDHVSV